MAEIRLTTWDVENLVNNGINYLSTGAGFLPSTVWCNFLDVAIEIIPMKQGSVKSGIHRNNDYNQDFLHCSMEKKQNGIIWICVEPHHWFSRWFQFRFKNISSSQIGSFPQVENSKKNGWNQFSIVAFFTLVQQNPCTGPASFMTFINQIRLSIGSQKLGNWLVNRFILSHYNMGLGNLL